MKKEVRAVLFLLATALIWGLSFTVQTKAVQHIGPITFTAIRCIVASFFLVLMYFFFRQFVPMEKEWSRKDTVIGGLSTGFILVFAINFQQLGLIQTTAGKAGFITTLYIMIVPILGLLIGHRIHKRTFFCVILACIGLYFLSIKKNFTIEKGDFLVFISAFFFAIHILAISIFSKSAQGILMSAIQMLICGIVSGLLATMMEEVDFSLLRLTIPAILYMGILSSGLGYTFQLLGIRDLDPTLASLITSLESIFAAIGGWIFLHQAMTPRELFGGLIVFVATVIAQLPDRREKIDV